MITSYTQTRIRGYTTVTVVSTLAAPVWYYWYVAGAYVAKTQVPTYALMLEPNEQVRIECLDTQDSDFDPIANAPTGYPSRRSICWVRSLATDVDYYRIETKAGAGDWTTDGRVYHSESTWYYQYTTGPLTDLTSYQFRVIPVDLAGNDGTAVTIDAETVVRTPDAPRFSVSYDGGTERVTFAEVS